MAKLGYGCGYVKHKVYLVLFFIYYCIIYFYHNCKPAFAHPCILDTNPLLEVPFAKTGLVKNFFWYFSQDGSSSA